MGKVKKKVKTVAQLLKRNVRRTDIVAPYGGDELSIFLTETDRERTREVAEKLKAVLGARLSNGKARPSM